MSKSLLSAAADIETLNNVEDVWNAATSVLAAEGIPIVLHLASDHERARIRLLSTHPKIHSGHATAEDPFLEWCCNNYDITCTGVEFMDDYDYLDEADKAFIREAAAEGFRSGMAIPMRLDGSASFGGFNLGTGLDRASFLEQVYPLHDTLRFFCLVIHRRLEELTQDPSEVPAPGEEFRTRLLSPASERLEMLTPREREVIYLQSQGLPRKEVARLCGISPHTVAEYTTKAYRKLGVANRTEAAKLIFET